MRNRAVSSCWECSQCIPDGLHDGIAIVVAVDLLHTYRYLDDTQCHASDAFGVKGLTLHRPIILPGIHQLGGVLAHHEHLCATASRIVDVPLHDVVVVHVDYF